MGIEAMAFSGGGHVDPKMPKSVTGPELVNTSSAQHSVKAVYNWTNNQLQAAADEIHAVLPPGVGRSNSVTTVSVTQDGIVVVSVTGKIPTPAQREAAKKIFGSDVEIVSGGVKTNAIGESGHHGRGQRHKTFGGKFKRD